MMKNVETITLAEFIPMLTELADTWPQIASANRAKRYFAAIADLEKDIVENICNHFLDTSLKMPLPSDFAEANRLFKKTYFEKSGQYYGAQKKSTPLGDHKIECSDCFDSGFKWVEYHEQLTFVFCSCSKGKHQQKYSRWILPNCNEISGLKMRSFPIKAFIPGDRNPNGAEFKSIVSKFDDAMKEAEAFWRFYLKKTQKSEN